MARVANVDLLTNRVRVPGKTIPVDANYVTYRRTKDNVWSYRFHATERAAKIRHGKNERAHDRMSYVEFGWKVITPLDREAGVWLW